MKLRSVWRAPVALSWGSTLNFASVTMVDFDPVGGWVPTGQSGRIKNQRERVCRQLHQDRALAQRSVRKRKTGRTGARASPQMWSVSGRFLYLHQAASGIGADFRSRTLGRHGGRSSYRGVMIIDDSAACHVSIWAIPSPSCLDLRTSIQAIPESSSTSEKTSFGVSLTSTPSGFLPGQPPTFLNSSSFEVDS